MIDILVMFGSTILQNASNTFVSRARNGDSLKLNAIASVCSNTAYLLVLRQVVTRMDSMMLLVVYVAGATTGSVLMHYISMRWIEKTGSKRGG